MDFVWPILEDIDSARDAARYAAAWTVVLCALWVLATALSGFALIANLICVLYGFAAWHIWHGSTVWSIIAFSLCILQTLLVLISLPLLWSIITPFAFLGLMNGIRATAAMERLSKPADTMKFA
jgi:hypothetical protein